MLRRISAQLCVRCAWPTRTPFGDEVEPDVYCTKATPASGSGGRETNVAVDGDRWMGSRREDAVESARERAVARADEALDGNPSKGPRRGSPSGCRLFVASTAVEEVGEGDARARRRARRRTRARDDDARVGVAREGVEIRELRAELRERCGRVWGVRGDRHRPRREAPQQRGEEVHPRRKHEERDEGFVDGDGARELRERVARLARLPTERRGVHATPLARPVVVFEAGEVEPTGVVSRPVLKTLEGMARR